MKLALQQLVQSNQYRGYEFEDDIFAPRISGEEFWDLLERVAKACGPLMLLLRLADTNKATLSKLKGTVEWMKLQLTDSGEMSVEDQISAAFHNRAPELECDVASAAYVLDPQFVRQSRQADQSVMDSFWRVSRNVLFITDDTEWRQTRQIIVSELASFRMQTGGFACEVYDNVDTCAFWGAAGCHAPTLRRLAFCLCSLPCSSGEAERNWQEVKSNLTKNRNRMGKQKLERAVFVRRFLRMKRAMCFNQSSDTGFQTWIEEMLKKVSRETDPGGDAQEQEDHAVDARRHIFQDHIEPGEQGKIDGKEPGQPVVRLTELKRDHAAKSWLFQKYYRMHFVDKNPEGDGDSAPLEDENEWEHRIILNVVWWRHHGYAVETALKDVGVQDQSLEKYLINDSLHEMIRTSPHNLHTMASRVDDGGPGRVDDGGPGPPSCGPSTTLVVSTPTTNSLTMNV